MRKLMLSLAVLSGLLIAPAAFACEDCPEHNPGAVVLSSADLNPSGTLN
ncbi:hypothetical protein [Egbenema bharatensis]